MPSFLSRLRSLASKRSISHSSSGAPEHADQTVDSAQHATLSPDASYSPRTPDFALDSKIAPDISALLASVEEDTADIRNGATEDIYDDTADVYYEGREGFVQGLKPRPPVAGASKYAIAEVQDKGIEDRGKGKDAISDTISSAGGVPPSTHNFQKRWSTFGREGKRVIPSMRSFVRAQSSRKEASEITMSLASQSQSHLGRSSDNKTLSSGTTASRPSTVVTGTERTTSTFGRPPIPSRPPTGVSSTRTPSRQSSGRFSVRDNALNPDGNALLSWSPPAEIIADEQSILDSSSSSSHSDSAQAPSPEAHEVEEQNVVNSPSPRTFGHPTPHHQQSHIMATTVPFPPFHSTPLSTPTRAADQGNQRTSLFRFADSSLSPISTTLGRAFRSNSERSNTAKTARSTGNLRDRRPSRSRSTLRSQTRRRSAVWSAEAASVGVVAGSTQDFGWPADVSREMLRLSLGEEAAYTTQEAVQRQEAGKTVQDTRNRALSAPIYLPTSNKLPVAEDWHASNSSHELLTSTSRQDKHGLMRAGAQGSSSHPISSNSFPFPSSSSSPASPTLLYSSGLAEPINLGNLAREHQIQNPKDSVRSQTRELDDKPENANDVDSEVVQQSGGGEDQMIQHVRSDSADQIRWDSRRLQEYLASSGGGEKAVDLAALRPSTPIMKADSASTYQTAASSSLLQPPSLSVQAPTPQGSPGHSRQESSPETDGENLQVPATTSTPEASEKSKGKRKAEESEGESPPGLKIGRKTTFATPLGGRGPPRVSDSSHAPSSFMSRQSSRKRVRLSSPMPTPDHSRPGSSTNAPVFNSVSSRGSSRSFITSALSHSKSAGPSMPSPTASSPPRPSSRASRAKSMSAASTSAGGRIPNRRSFSQASIPISAIVSPRAPTISNHSSFHMRDPRKPPRRRPVRWRLRLKTFEDDGSPFPAWAFWFGFFMPVLWFIASFWRMPRTRTVGTDTEKAIVVDDPQVEREARAWRLRCRVASGIFFFTYVPVIVLIAVFATRS